MAEFVLRNISDPVVMAILNVTPDSFFSDNRWIDSNQFRNNVIKTISEGADIIDVGGYSSRPGAENISVEEETDRVIRAIEIIRSISKSIPISIDTFRSYVVEQIVNKYGKIIVNDISAGEADSQMLKTIAKFKIPYIAMHMRGTPQNMQQLCNYNDIISEINVYFEDKINLFKKIGIHDFALDPGFGFAKNTGQNHELLGRLHELVRDEIPILVGISRKSMIYKILEATPTEALSGTIALNWEALRQGAKILRVHDVQPAVDCIKLFKYFSKYHK